MFELRRYRGKFAAVRYDEAGKRHRYTLGTDSEDAARREIARLNAALRQPDGPLTVAQIWDAYVQEMEGRAVARIEALSELTWDRVDFAAGLIYLDDPEDGRRRKGRATVPMNGMARAAPPLRPGRRLSGVDGKDVRFSGLPARSGCRPQRLRQN